MLKIEDIYMVKFVALGEGSIIIMFEIPVKLKKDLQFAAHTQKEFLRNEGIIGITIDDEYISSYEGMLAFSCIYIVYLCMCVCIPSCICFIGFFCFVLFLFFLVIRPSNFS